tara:strand:+ start:923 stop:1975 length:1053 start_codon:yes stop_codon:yes gene_type:complete
MSNKLFKSKFYSYAGTFLFILFFIILFRDFLYTYRLQLEKFFPYYAYQDQIIYYLTGDENFDIEAPMNLRFLGLYIQFLIYKLIPCIELNHLVLGEYAYENYVCATFSSAFMNYLSLCGILSVTFVYCYRKLNLSTSESILTVLLSYIFINHVEAFTLDRISILYFLIVLYFLDNKKTSLLLILCSAFVNEKIIYILAGLFFIRLFLNKKKEFKLYFFITLLSGLLVLIIFSIYAFLLNNGYYQSDHENGLYDTMFSQGLERILKMFTTKSGLSNSSVPLLLSVIPYILSIKLKVNKFYYSNLDFLIPISMLFFTTGGGMEQTGRYVMYTIPLWLPIFSQQILILIKKNR